MATNRQIARSSARCLDVKEESFIYLPTSGAIFRLAGNAREIWRRLDTPRSGITSPDAWGEDIDNHAISDETIEEMVGLGILTRTRDHHPDDIMRDSIFPENLFKRGIGSLVLLITNACNLACSYCFAKGGNYGGAEKGGMSADTAIEWLRFLAGNAEGRRSLDVTLMGGEPLLNFDLIRRIIAESTDIERKYDKHFNFSLTTNATRITPKIAKFLDSHRISVLVSIDGPKEVHDMNRPTRAGNGSYDAASNGISIMKEHYRHRPLVARVTLTKHSLNVREIYDHLLEMGFDEVGFAPVSTSDDEMRFGAEEYAHFNGNLMELSERVISRVITNGEPLRLSNLRVSLLTFRDGIAKPFPCGAGIGLFTGDTKGDLYLCHRLAGGAQWKVGTLKEGLDCGKRREVLLKYWGQTKEECRACWLKYLCSGGCYHEVEQEQDRVECGKAFCASLREWMEYVLGVYVRLMETGGKEDKQWMRSSQ